MNSFKNYQLIRVTGYGLRVFKNKYGKQINAKVTSFLRAFSQLATRNSLTRNLSYLLFCLFVISLQSCLSDIRTDAAKSSGTAEINLNKGKELLANIHPEQSPAAWEGIEVYELTLGDEFFGLMGSIASPFPGKKMTAQAVYAPGSYDGKLTFNSGKLKGETWGMQSWKTYTQKDGGKAVFEKHKKAAFWVPTYQYFVELSARIQNATIISYAGEQTFNGQTYDLVYATWKSQEPQKDIDQYMVWINQNTKMMDLVEFTVRDAFGGTRGVAFYEDLQEVTEGLLLPKQISIKTKKENEGLLHQMKLSDFKANHVPVSEVRPDANLKTMGDDKG